MQQKKKGRGYFAKCNKILSDPNDDDQIFGEYVSSVLRSFSSAGNKKLRRIIQRAIVDIQDEEEGISSRGSSTQSTYLHLPIYSPVSTFSENNVVISANQENTAEHTYAKNTAEDTYAVEDQPFNFSIL